MDGRPHLPRGRLLSGPDSIGRPYEANEAILPEHVTGWHGAPFSALLYRWPWELTSRSEGIVEDLIPTLGADFCVSGTVAVHGSVRIEDGARLKGPAIVGPGCLIASGSLLRGGCWLERDCVVGPGVELKSSFVFAGSRLAHFNFVGDSVLGADVNLEAGAIIANFRNERERPTIACTYRSREIETGVQKFGALVGDGARIGANAVIAPGAILPPAARVGRLALIDQDPDR